MAILLETEFNRSINDEYKAAIYAASCAAEKNNIKIFLIGGIVRDIIMHHQIKDIDIAVLSDAVEFSKILEKDADFKIISVQDNLRTVKAQFINGVEIDFASTRQEKYDKSGFLPIAYNFGCDLKSDVQRRDFTINTLALSLTGEDKYSLIDYFNGYNDILNKQIKILHEKSFIDDPSRIIRALKFMVRFDFDIENSTYELIQKYLTDINDTMPLERIKNELKQYFSLDNEKKLYDIVIKTNAYKLISDNVILQFNSDFYNEISKYNLFDNNNKWFLFVLMLIFKSKYAIERLNLSSAEKKSVQDLKELYYNKIPNNNYDIYKAFTDKTNLAVAGYFVITGSNYLIKFLEELKNIHIQTNGNDLINLGFKPSPKFNEIFENILREKLDGKLITKSEELEYIKIYYLTHKS